MSSILGVTARRASDTATLGFRPEPEPRNRWALFVSGWKAQLWAPVDEKTRIRGGGSGASTLAGEAGEGAEAGKQGVLEPKSEGTGSLERTRGPSAAESGERRMEMSPLIRPEGALETLSSAQWWGSGQRLRGQWEGRRDNSPRALAGMVERAGRWLKAAEGSGALSFHGALNLRPTGSASSFRTSLSTE